MKRRATTVGSMAGAAAHMPGTVATQSKSRVLCSHSAALGRFMAGELFRHFARFHFKSAKTCIPIRADKCSILVHSGQPLIDKLVERDRRWLMGAPLPFNVALRICSVRPET